MLLLDCAGIATMAGLQFGGEVAVDEVAAEVVAPTVSALLFDDLDGERRLVPLTIIDRIEPVPVEAIRFSGGRLRLSVEGRIIPLAVQGEWDRRDMVSVLRLRDGDAEIGYAISDAIDIVTLPETVVPAREAGPVAGVVSIDGEQIELLDLHWLFATHGAELGAAAPPVCLIDGAESAWMTTFLKPVLEGAGYRVATGLKTGEAAAVVLTMSASGAPVQGNVPVVRLRRDRAVGGPADTSIYRYDRDGLLAALARSAGGR
jgi:two-component system chemotaxis sensor kinase CheA